MLQLLKYTILHQGLKGSASERLISCLIAVCIEDPKLAVAHNTYKSLTNNTIKRCPQCLPLAFLFSFVYIMKAFVVLNASLGWMKSTGEQASYCPLPSSIYQNAPLLNPCSETRPVQRESSMILNMIAIMNRLHLCNTTSILSSSVESFHTTDLI